MDQHFPVCLFEKDSYVGIKGFFGVIFLASLIYFMYGIIHFLMWDSSFWTFAVDLIAKPFYLLYHIGVFGFMYCVTWAVFDFELFKACFLKFFALVFSIAYIVSPVDFLPDILPIVGQIDDFIAIVIAVYNAVTMGRIYELPEIKRKQLK